MAITFWKSLFNKKTWSRTTLSVSLHIMLLSPEYSTIYKEKKRMFTYKKFTYKTLVYLHKDELA